MSNSEEQVVEQKTAISPEDCDAALDFWRHFNIPIPIELQSSIDAFAVEPTIENQDRIRLEVCNAIYQSEHEAFKDDMFAQITEECKGIVFDMQFDKDFEATVVVKE